MSLDDPKTPMQRKIDDLVRIINLREEEVRRWLDRAKDLEDRFAHPYVPSTVDDVMGDSIQCNKCGLPKKDLLHYVREDYERSSND